MANGNNPIDPNVFNIAGEVNPAMAQLDPGAAGTGAGFTQLLQNPIFLSFLADLGARIDPQGFGGAIGGATKEMIQAQAVSKALGKTSRGRKGELEDIIAALGDDTNGLTELQLNPDGSIKSLKGTAVPQSALAETPATSPPAESTAAEVEPIGATDNLYQKLLSGKITPQEFDAQIGTTLTDIYGTGVE